MIVLTRAIALLMPYFFVVGTIANYVINAVLVLFFLAPILVPAMGSTAAYWVAGSGAVTFQFFRATIVGWGLLTPDENGEVPGIVKFIALTSTVIATIELWFALGHSNFESSGFWAVFVFSACIVWGGYVLEILFVNSAHKSIVAALEGAEEDIEEEKESSSPAPPAAASGPENRFWPKVPTFELNDDDDDNFIWEPDFPGMDHPENPAGKN